uniref:Uncharacterized protein n=1 Tax=Nelumbo nucifera TaxID=4432 RepID=A0A822YUT7_NELNU|nr:TPA_asm: hypothetical protein HUJ06_011859 [Nelumbo nucifera]
MLHKLSLFKLHICSVADDYIKGFIVTCAIFYSKLVFVHSNILQNAKWFGNSGKGEEGRSFGPEI